MAGERRRVDKERERLVKFGRQIRRLRQDRDLSQEALADLAATHRNHLGAIERGTKAAGLGTIFKLADALGVAPAQLFSPFDAQAD